MVNCELPWLLATCYQCLIIVFQEFSILSWNIRGAANRQAKSLMRELIGKYKLTLCFIFELHVQFAKMEKF